MKVLITAGGTREDIDDIRSITNHSTGRLGSIVADKFIQEGADVTYVCGENATLPSNVPSEIIYVRSTQNLLDTIERLLQSKKYDCVIHAMAVSDYTPTGIIYADDPNSVIHPLDVNKISSNGSGVMLVLKPTAKVINRIKILQPETFLIGFKLVSNLSEDDLLLAATNVLEKNQCDIVAANDLRDISIDTHKAIFIGKTGIISRASTKHDIADFIYTSTIERVAK